MARQMRYEDEELYIPERVDFAGAMPVEPKAGQYFASGNEGTATNIPSLYGALGEVNANTGRVVAGRNDEVRDAMRRAVLASPSGPRYGNVPVSGMTGVASGRRGIPSYADISTVVPGLSRPEAMRMRMAFEQPNTMSPSQREAYQRSYIMPIEEARRQQEQEDMYRRAMELRMGPAKEATARSKWVTEVNAATRLKQTEMTNTARAALEQMRQAGAKDIAGMNIEQRDRVLNGQVEIAKMQDETKRLVSANEIRAKQEEWMAKGLTKEAEGLELAHRMYLGSVALGQVQVGEDDATKAASKANAQAELAKYGERAGEIRKNLAASKQPTLATGGAAAPGPAAQGATDNDRNGVADNATWSAPDGKRYNVNNIINSISAYDALDDAAMYSAPDGRQMTGAEWKRQHASQYERNKMIVAEWKKAVRPSAAPRQ